MLIATKAKNNVQQQKQQLIGSKFINKNNNNNNNNNKKLSDEGVQLITTTAATATTTNNKLTEFAYGRKEDTLLSCDSEAKQRHEALAKKWNMKYMHYKNNNKELDKQQQQCVDASSYLNIKAGGVANVERARRGRRPNGRGMGNRGRGMAATGKELPPNSLYAAAMLTVAKMKAKRGAGGGGGRGANNRTKARLYATLIGSTTNSSASFEEKTTTEQRF